jgi:hypothetical protein
MLIATRLDGYVRVRSGKQEELALAGQLGARSVDRIANTRAGQLFIDEYLDDSAWRLEAGAWKEASFAPPFVPHLLEPVTVPPTTSWYKTKLLIGASGEVSTVNQSAMSPGTVTTAAWRDGRAVVLGRQMTDLYVHGTFVTPDDGVWNLNFGEIRRFANGWWIPVGKYPAAPPGAPGIQTGTSLRPVSLGPPWIVLAPASGQLLALTPASGPTGARLELREIKDSAGNARKVSDAIPWAPGQLLLATDRGLAVYAPASGRLTAAAIPAPPRPVTRLCVDRKNRLWLGGDGLWFVDGKDGLRSLDALPMIAGSQVEAIADDGPDGVVVSLGERGVVRLTLAPR